MDNMNRIPRISSFENNLRNTLSDYINDSLEHLETNNQRRNNETNLQGNINRQEQTSSNQVITNILDSLNRSMLLYHVNIFEYLNKVNSLINSLEVTNQQNAPSHTNNTSQQEILGGRTHTRYNRNTQTQRNEHLRPRDTYYYRTRPIRTNLSQETNINNDERSDIWRSWGSRSPIHQENNHLRSPTTGLFNRYSTRNIDPLDISGQTNTTNRHQRRPFQLYQFFSQNNEPVINNELMQQYFQNLFQNVIIRPTAEQINNATETFSYTTELDLINHSCPITLEEFQEQQIIRRIKQCGHCFSEESIQSWFQNNVRCPVCRLDIRDVSGNSINANNNHLEDASGNINDSSIDSNENIPSPRPLTNTLSDISTSSSSIYNDTFMDTFMSNFANSIRDNLSENLENLLEPYNGDISSHVQIEIPLEDLNYINHLHDVSNNMLP